MELFRAVSLSLLGFHIVYHWFQFCPNEVYDSRETSMQNLMMGTDIWLPRDHAFFCANREIPYWRYRLHEIDIG